MPGNQKNYARISNALENGEISREDLERCAVRILKLSRELS
jgi:hypothetical protein